MTVKTQSFKRLWAASLAVLGAVTLVSCASSTPGPAPVAAQAWSGFSDCFQRDVAVPVGGAERMAQTCSGDNAAGDPSRSGIVRANAYFNAAAAFNTLAASASPSRLCQSRGACSQTALNLLEKSLASQQDNQIRPTASASQNAVNQRFVLRRKLERSRALRGLASSGYADASCGSAATCLTTASQMLASINVEPALASDDGASITLACAILDIRWRVDSDIGREREYHYVDDLRRIVQACPPFAASATDRLAEISFERAERIRESLAQSDPPPSVEAALGAITDYRDALSVARFRLPANRGMGAVYRTLATREPASAQTYLERATDAFGDAVALGAQTETPAPRAKDLEQLGTSLIDLAHASSQPGTPEWQDLFERAAKALQDSTNLVATPARYVRLGEAYGEIGKYDQSISAYRSAIGGLSGPEKIRATLALADIYDRAGKPDLALQTLVQASAQGAASADVQYEIGRREFTRGRLKAALDALRPAIGDLGGNRAADAHYMMSVAEVALRKPEWPQRALIHAERAVSLNGRTWEYKRQLCLATILRGGKSVRNGSSLLRCPESETSPEAYLLRGMYYLKQAQSLDVSAYSLASQTRWREILRSAENAFMDGQDALENARDGEKVVWYDDLQKEIDLGRTLAQGLTVIQRCNREITIGPNDPAWKDLDAFYGYYGVLKCS